MITDLTAIKDRVFKACKLLLRITVLDTIAHIDDQAFAYCTNIAEYHLQSTTPPTLSTANIFTQMSADCTIYVPPRCLEAYQTATNWSAYSSHMQEEPSELHVDHYIF